MNDSFAHKLLLRLIGMLGIGGSLAASHHSSITLESLCQLAIHASEKSALEYTWRPRNRRKQQQGSVIGMSSWLVGGRQWFDHSGAGTL